MSFGGGGGDNSQLLQMLRDQESRANAEADRLRAQNKVKSDLEEEKRVNRTRAGGLAAFTTAGYTGYNDKTLGSGSSLTATV